MTEARIAPVPRAEWSSEMTTFIAEFQASVRGDRPPANRPGGANLLGTLARYPALAKPFLTFNGHLLYGTLLSARQRELLILRVATLRHCDYEWAQHRLLGGDAGLTEAEIELITDVGPAAAQWTPLERALLAAVDELVADAVIADATWAALAAELDERALMDVVFTVGTYELVAMALRAFAIVPEPDLVPHLRSRA